MPRFASAACTFLVMSAASLQTSIAAAQECRKDMDCPGDTVCDEGRCVGEDGPAPQYTPAAPVAPAPAGSEFPAQPAQSAPVAQAPQPAPLAGSVKLDFVPRKANESLLVRDMHTNASCTAPCSLSLPPGRRSIQVGNDRPEDFDVPAQGGRFTVAEPERGQRTFGIVFLSVGAPIALLGTVAAVAASSSSSSDSDSFGHEESDSSGRETGKIVGFSMLGIGGFMALLGFGNLVAADTKPIRPDDGKHRVGTSTPTQLVPLANVNGQGGGFLGLKGTF